VRAFTVAAEELHFRRAAERLHMTQPALSQQIAKLEAALGVRLFDRSRHRVALTASGTAFLPHARRVVRDSERAVAAARGAAAAPVSLAVSYTRSVEVSIMTDLLEVLDAASPQLEILWILRAEDAVAAELRAGQYDASLGRYPYAARGLRSEILFWERAALFVSRSDPLALLDEVPVSALEGRRIVISSRQLSPQRFDTLARDLAEADVDAQLDARLNSANWASREMQGAIASGACVSIGTIAASRRLTEVAVVPLAVSPVPLSLTTREDDDRDETRRFVDLLRASVDDCRVFPNATWRAPAPVRRG
jgi:DNA-binding transcriptional LysR family regulator